MCVWMGTREPRSLANPQGVSIVTVAAYRLDVDSKPFAFTIGYAGRTLTEFVRLLVDSDVERVVDVRALPLSRRRGFSKSALSATLAEHGIEYVHIRRAGNPYRACKEDIERCLSLYACYLDDEPEVVVEVEGALQARRSALLCVEADPRDCHRSVIADRLRKRHPRRRISDL
jgi:uncharacterized protein (DUF488 family)